MEKIRHLCDLSLLHLHSALKFISSYSASHTSVFVRGRLITINFTAADDLLAPLWHRTMKHLCLLPPAHMGVCTLCQNFSIHIWITVSLIKEAILCFWGFCLSFCVLCCIFVHVQGLQREKSQSPRQRELLFSTENTALALPI